jgi:hypothetical protein
MPPTPETTTDDDALELARLLEKLAGRDPAGIPEGAVQRAMSAIVQLYANKFEAGERFSPLPEGHNVPATTVLLTTTALLRAANLELFELGMWQSWSGTR